MLWRSGGAAEGVERDGSDGEVLQERVSDETKAGGRRTATTGVSVAMSIRQPSILKDRLATIVERRFSFALSNDLHVATGSRHKLRELTNVDVVCDKANRGITKHKVGST